MIIALCILFSHYNSLSLNNNYTIMLIKLCALQSKKTTAAKRMLELFPIQIAILRKSAFYVKISRRLQFQIGVACNIKLTIYFPHRNEIIEYASLKSN